MQTRNRDFGKAAIEKIIIMTQEIHIEILFDLSEFFLSRVDFYKEGILQSRSVSDHFIRIDGNIFAFHFIPLTTVEL